MALPALKEYLEENKVTYETIKHVPAYTAQEIAAAAHIPGKDLLKAIVVKVDGKLALMIEPSTSRVDLSALKKALKAKDAEITSEYEFESSFPECELGAMPIFGNLFGLPVYAAKRVKDEESVAFNAGNHEELIKMKWKDFLTLVKPKVVDA